MLSVVLCVRNGQDHIREQLESLAAQDYEGPWELIVVDDGSTDQTTSIVDEFALELPLHLVRVRHGTGLANARNVGCAHARGELVAFCDADDVADPSWLSALVRASEHSQIVGGHLEERELNDELVWRWRYPMTDGGLPGAFERWITPVGANMAVSASLLTSLGGFDPALATGEEVDLAIRAQIAGHVPFYAADAVVHYRHRHGELHLARQAYRYGKGNTDLYRRHRDAGIPPVTAGRIVGTMWRILRGVPKACLSRASRGAWLRFAAYTAGQLRRSLQLRVFWLG